MTLGIGSRIGSFEIIGTLGRGGMGEVYRARDTRLDRDVAILSTPYYTANNRPYDVSPDGQRFLMIKESTSPGPVPASANIIVVLNWFTELKKRLP